MRIKFNKHSGTNIGIGLWREQRFYNAIYFNLGRDVLMEFAAYLRYMSIKTIALFLAACMAASCTGGWEARQPIDGRLKERRMGIAV